MKNSGRFLLRQSCATQPTVLAECFSVSIIHRTLTWTTGSLTCSQMLMHAIAHGGCKDTRKRVSHPQWHFWEDQTFGLLLVIWKLLFRPEMTFRASLSVAHQDKYYNFHRSKHTWKFNRTLFHRTIRDRTHIFKESPLLCLEKEDVLENLLPSTPPSPCCPIKKRSIQPFVCFDFLSER